MSRALPHAEFWTIPNLLSLGRLVLAAVVFGLIAYGLYLAAVVVFVLAAISDAVDGYLARVLNQATALGRQLDPLIDKVVVAGCFIYLLTVPGSGLAPWMVTVIIARELIVQALRSQIEGQGRAFGAKMAGKLKTTTQFLAIVAILLILGLDLGGPWLWVRDALLWGAVLLTLYSGGVYLVAAWPILRGRAPGTPAP